MNKPTLGRIVQYNTTENDRLYMSSQNRTAGCNNQKKLPATIVAVFGEDSKPEEQLCNLKVMLDGQAQDLWVTSAHCGDNEGEWNWFTRV